MVSRLLFKSVKGECMSFLPTHIEIHDNSLHPILRQSPNALLSYYNYKTTLLS